MRVMSFIQMMLHTHEQKRTGILSTHAFPSKGKGSTCTEVEVAVRRENTFLSIIIHFYRLKLLTLPHFCLISHLACRSRLNSITVSRNLFKIP